MFCSYVRLLQGCIARTDSPMHEIENAAEALMKDLYLGLPCTDAAQVECLHVQWYRLREYNVEDIFINCWKFMLHKTK